MDYRISGFCCRLYHPISGQRSRINEIQCDSARSGGKKTLIGVIMMKIFAIYVKNLFFLGTKCIGNCGCRRTTWPNFHPQTIRLTRLTGNQSSPFREHSAGNSTKVKDVLGVISNTPALNVEAITLPQNASRETNWRHLSHCRIQSNYQHQSK